MHQCTRKRAEGEERRLGDLMSVLPTFRKPRKGGTPGSSIIPDQGRYQVHPAPPSTTASKAQVGLLGAILAAVGKGSGLAIACIQEACVSSALHGGLYRSFTGCRQNTSQRAVGQVRKLTERDAHVTSGVRSHAALLHISRIFYPVPGLC